MGGSTNANGTTDRCFAHPDNSRALTEISVVAPNPRSRGGFTREKHYSDLIDAALEVLIDATSSPQDNTDLPGLANDAADMISSLQVQLRNANRRIEELKRDRDFYRARLNGGSR